MTSTAFSPDWIKQFSDPYAILGVAVTADERRISKRYRQVAKQLHPDQQMQADEDARKFANQTLTQLVNPAYQRLKQDKGRDETLATLRFKVRRLSREEKLIPSRDLAKRLSQVDEAEVEVLYENFLAELSDAQHTSVESFTEQTLAIAELNLTYLQRTLKTPVIRNKRAGLVPAASVNATPTPMGGDGTATPVKEEPPQVDYAQRHVIRAKTYIASKCFPEAIRELQDAVRIEPENSNYHTMLGQAYLMQKMVGMAKVHIRHALKLDAQNPIARKYAKQLELDIQRPQAKDNKQSKTNGHRKSGGLFSFFNRKRAAK
ncbi:DnaJ domain-containing protein [Oscillatoria sp. CS-180]|uniref:J domain-containing protein n=1 Tax=Oscillatoria sp. CS-180 TaxID=3021720 RepID=UPI00232C58F8|nr:DnaJ domain-containing protein [Oscillatoria sp. CS-180]MDB9526870.1 DnaJ domain-containing protein [Oscillatoria sp. CS-180]